MLRHNNCGAKARPDAARAGAQAACTLSGNRAHRAHRLAVALLWRFCVMLMVALSVARVTGQARRVAATGKCALTSLE